MPRDSHFREAGLWYRLPPMNGQHLVADDRMGVDDRELPRIVTTV
jgi:hypothetical protein